MNGLHPRSPDDYLRLFVVSQMYGFPVFLPEGAGRPPERVAPHRKRRLRSFVAATRRRLREEPAVSRTLEVR